MYVVYLEYEVLNTGPLRGYLFVNGRVCLAAFAAPLPRGARTPGVMSVHLFTLDPTFALGMGGVRWTWEVAQRGSKGCELHPVTYESFLRHFLTVTKISIATLAT